MRVLHADDWFWITGRGPVAVFSKRVWTPPVTIGEEMIIDGGLYTVRGIERQGIPRDPDRPTTLGALVAPSTKINLS